VTSLTLANGVVETTTYNNRMQPTCLAASAAPAFQVGLAYGSGESVCGASTGAGNNGNVMKQRITRGSTVWNQIYTYDDVNRLQSVNEDAVSGGSSWGQTYDIDRWGNRAVMPAGYIPNPWQTATNLNEFGNNRWYGLGTSAATYDKAGNQKTAAGGTRSFSYDGENRLIAATEPNTGAIGYGYDGEGRRVWKTVGEKTTWFVYDAQGQLAAEYGEAAAAPCTTCFVTVDWLGSTRLVTDGAKAVQRGIDYLPFGEEIENGHNGRTAGVYGLGVNGSASYPGAADGVTARFTGKERDAETGLDYFLARYYSPAQGRFTSPDEWAGGIVDPFTGRQLGQPGPLPYSDISDPQTLNKYAYVRNSPLRYVDPDGHADKEATLTDRIVLGVTGIANMFVGGKKVEAAVVTAMTTPLTTAPGAAAAGYAGVSGTGQFIAGNIQLIGAIRGDLEGAEKLSAAVTVSTSISGVMTMAATNGDMEAASKATNIEAIVTPSLTRSVFDNAAAFVDAVLNVKDLVGPTTSEPAPPPPPPPPPRVGEVN
jgi:RHS repeat-associated protein